MFYLEGYSCLFRFLDISPAYSLSNCLMSSFSPVFSFLFHQIGLLFFVLQCRHSDIRNSLPFFNCIRFSSLSSNALTHLTCIFLRRLTCTHLSSLSFFVFFIYPYTFTSICRLFKHFILPSIRISSSNAHFCVV